MINLGFVIFLLTSHWLLDFVCQSDRMALSKSKDNWALSEHVGLYTLGLWMLTIGNSWGAIFYAPLNGVLHWCTDWVTSRWTAYLWKAERRHDFFVVIGFDQLVHVTTLLVTAHFILDFAH